MKRVPPPWRQLKNRATFPIVIDEARGPVDDPSIIDNETAQRFSPNRIKEVEPVHDAVVPPAMGRREFKQQTIRIIRPVISRHSVEVASLVKDETRDG